MTRRRYVCREIAPGVIKTIELGSDETVDYVSTGDLGKFQYDNLRSTDGADLSSRQKVDQYLKATGLALSSDYKEAGPKARAERDRHYDTGKDAYKNAPRAWKEEAKRDIYNAIQHVRGKRR